MRETRDIVCLGDVCHIIGGGTPSKKNDAYYSGSIPWATVRDMNAEVISETDFRITKEAVQASSTNIIPAGNVVIATRVGLGKVCLLSGDTAINQDLRGIIPKQPGSLLPRYLFYWFKTIAPHIISAGTGATVQGVKGNFVKSLRFPLPPLPEQKRIVAILDEAFAGIATAVANTEKNLANARELFDSYLNAVFTQKGEGWVEKTIGEIADHSLGKMLDKAKNKGSLKPYLRNINVRWFEFDLNDMLEMRFEDDESQTYTAKKGDVLICEGGYPGRSAIWENDEPVYFQKALHRVRFKNIEHNKWFPYFIYLADAKNDLRKYFTGTGIQHFTGKALHRFRIPIPPTPVIRKSVERFDALFEETHRLESLYQHKLTTLAELKQSLLHKAFSGALTSQSVSVLQEAVA